MQQKWSDMLMQSWQCWLVLHVELVCVLLWLLSHSRRSHRKWLAHMRTQARTFLVQPFKIAAEVSCSYAKLIPAV